MLGRYIAGTVLILGVAMVMAPDAPEKEPSIAVARTETSPATLETAEPEEMAAALRQSSDTVAAPSVDSSEPEPSAIQAGVNAALAQALALDATEAAGDAGVSAEQLAQPLGEESLLNEEAEETDVAALAGLKLDMDAGTDPFLRLPEPDAAPEGGDATLADRQARMMFVSGTKVNVRAGPSTQYRVVDTVVFGDEVELVAYEGEGWARIRIGNSDRVGFMSRKFLEHELSGG